MSPHTDDYDRDLELARKMMIDNEMNRRDIRFVLGLFMVIIVAIVLAGLITGFVNW